MKNIEKVLPFAIDAINKFILNSNDNTIPKEFKGYIASFGASIIQSGVKPSLAFYSQSKDSKGDRAFLIPALIYILINDGLFNAVKEDTLKVLVAIETDPKVLKNQMFFLISEVLFRFIEEDEVFAKKKILEAATGLKLALRLFKTPEQTDE